MDRPPGARVGRRASDLLPHAGDRGEGASIKRTATDDVLRTLSGLCELNRTIYHLAVAAINDNGDENEDDALHVAIRTLAGIAHDRADRSMACR